MRIDLLTFSGCPHVEAARTQLRRALEEVRLPVEWNELDVRAATTPPELRGYGSPSILIDGVDVLGAAPADALACRYYPGSDLPGAPPLEALVGALQQAAAKPTR